MTLQSPKYWKRRLLDVKEFGIRCKHVKDLLKKYPYDYHDLRNELDRALEQNHLNMLWIRQEIKTRQEFQDYPGAKQNETML